MSSKAKPSYLLAVTHHLVANSFDIESNTTAALVGWLKGFTLSSPGSHSIKRENEIWLPIKSAINFIDLGALTCWVVGWNRTLPSVLGLVGRAYPHYAPLRAAKGTAGRLRQSTCPHQTTLPCVSGDASRRVGVKLGFLHGFLRRVQWLCPGSER